MTSQQHDLHPGHHGQTRIEVHECFILKTFSLVRLYLIVLFGQKTASTRLLTGLLKHTDANSDADADAREICTKAHESPPIVSSLTVLGFLPFRTRSRQHEVALTIVSEWARDKRAVAVLVLQ